MKLQEILESKKLFKKITFILFIICICFSFILFVQQPNQKLDEEYYDFGEIKIPKQQLEDLSDAVGSSTFTLCELGKEGDCIRLTKAKG